MRRQAALQQLDCQIHSQCAALLRPCDAWATIIASLGQHKAEAGAYPGGADSIAEPVEEGANKVHVPGVGQAHSQGALQLVQHAVLAAVHPQQVCSVPLRSCDSFFRDSIGGRCQMESQKGGT